MHIYTRLRKPSKIIEEQPKVAPQIEEVIKEQPKEEKQSIKIVKRYEPVEEVAETAKELEIEKVAETADKEETI